MIAVFWMWVIAFSARPFIESTLTQMYKIEQDGQYRGGPAYFIEKGLGLESLWYCVRYSHYIRRRFSPTTGCAKANSIATSHERSVSA